MDILLNSNMFSCFKCNNILLLFLSFSLLPIQLCFELSKPISQADSILIREAKMAGKPIPPKKIVYCSVREFTADEKLAILPKWVCFILYTCIYFT